MQFSIKVLALVALTLDCASTQPARHGHQHPHKRELADVLRKRQDYNNLNVDWATVNYGGGASPPAISTPPPQPAPSPAPAAQANPAPAPAPAANSNPSPAPVPAQEKVATSAKNTASSGGKRGLAYNPSSPDLNIFDGFSKVTWGYNWDSASAGLPTQFQYVPTLFSDAAIHTGNWDTNAKSAISGSGTSYLMAFNEPDMPAPQANMPVGTAVTAWKQYMAPYASGNVKLSSPSVSNGVGTNPTTGQPMGLDWLKPFLEQCSGCAISFVPVHWYGCTGGCDVQNDISAFKTQMTAAMQAAGSLPIWVTEFGTNSGDPTTFMNEVLPWLDGQDQVERYSYFMVQDGILTNGGSLSELGKQYGSS